MIYEVIILVVIVLVVRSFKYVYRLCNLKYHILLRNLKLYIYKIYEQNIKYIITHNSQINFTLFTYIYIIFTVCAFDLHRLLGLCSISTFVCFKISFWLLSIILFKSSYVTGWLVFSFNTVSSVLLELFLQLFYFLCYCYHGHFHLLTFLTLSFGCSISLFFNI